MAIVVGEIMQVCHTSTASAAPAPRPGSFVHPSSSAAQGRSRALSSLLWYSSWPPCPVANTGLLCVSRISTAVASSAEDHFPDAVPSIYSVAEDVRHLLCPICMSHGGREKVAIGSSCSDVAAVPFLVSLCTRDDTLELQQNFIFAQMLQGENASRLD